MNSAADGTWPPPQDPSDATGGGVQVTSGQRISAFYTDIALSTLVAAVSLVGVGLIFAAFKADSGSTFVIGMVLIAVGALISWGFFAVQVFLMSRRGATIGDRIAGIEMVKLDGSRPGLWASLGYLLLLNVGSSYTLTIGPVVMFHTAREKPDCATFLDSLVNLRATTERPRSFVALSVVAAIVATIVLLLIPFAIVLAAPGDWSGFTTAP